MNMKKEYRFLSLVFIVLYLLGCGYTTGSLLPSHLKTVYIETFKNMIDVSKEPSDKQGFMIYRPGVENDVTRKIIDQFIFDGNLRVVKKEDADLILRGGLKKYYKQPLRYDRFDNAEEYRIIVVVDIELFDAVGNKLMWKENDFIGYDTYRLAGAFASDEQEAREGAIEDLAEKTVEKVIEAW